MGLISTTSLKGEKGDDLLREAVLPKEKYDVALITVQELCIMLSEDHRFNAYLEGAVATQLGERHEQDFRDFDVVVTGGSVFDRFCYVWDFIQEQLLDKGFLDSGQWVGENHVKLRKLGCRDSLSRPGGWHFNLELYSQTYEANIKIGLFLPLEDDIFSYMPIARSDVLNPSGVSWSQVKEGGQLSLDTFRKLNCFSKIINCLITIENASRYGEVLIPEYMTEMIRILQLDLVEIYGGKDIGDDVVSYIDKRRVPDTVNGDLTAWRTRYWDLLVEYDILKVLFPETLGRLDSEELEIAKVHFIRNGSLEGLKERFSSLFA